MPTSLSFNVHNEGIDKEGVERNIGVPVIMVVMDEGTSSRDGDKEASLQGLGPKNQGTQSMGTENQSLVLKDKGKKTIGYGHQY